MKIYIEPSIQSEFLEEKTFDLFKSSGLICCVQLNKRFGTNNGYVAVPKGHKLYGKKRSDKVCVENINEVAFNGNYIGLFWQTKTRPK